MSDAKLIPLPFGERLGEGSAAAEAALQESDVRRRLGIPPLAPPFEGGGSDSGVSRRGFMAASGAAATLFAAPIAAGAQGANDRLRIGFIGPGRRGFGAHVQTLAKLRKQGANIELAAVNDVYEVHRQRAADFIAAQTGARPAIFRDYREMLTGGKLDAVFIGTPDHWHARQTIDALNAGVNVYCEKPMTHTLDEAREVVREWKATGRVLQVGVQSTSSPIWDHARGMIDDGQLGKVVQFQTEYFRNSAGGMSRHNEITPQMTPQAIDWPQWLGVKEGITADRPFDREVYAQWRCYWPYSLGMMGDLFVHRITCMLKATGLRMPGRVVAGGGIFLEYDDREVPDVASIIADFHEGVQGVVSSTMVSNEVKLDHAIRGHHGSIVFAGSAFGAGPKAGFEFIPERPQVTGDSSLRRETFRAAADHDFDAAHMANFLDAVRAGKPTMVNNDPELAASAVAIVDLAARSYREGKVLQMDRAGQVIEGNRNWAAGWEAMSRERAKPRHVPGWTAGDKGSVLTPPEYQKLAGPWIDGKPPTGI
jgi:predicted dehydrogenase